MPPKKREGARQSSAKIEDVARLAGVSIMTVSRAMRDTHGVSAQTRDEVRRIAKVLGYHPNRLAGSLASADSTLIGISVPTLFDAVFAEIFQAMREVLIADGFDTAIDVTEYQEQREQLWVERMLTWQPAGLVLSGSQHSAETRRLVRDSGIPTLEIWEYSNDPIDLSIGVDHFDAGYQMGQYLHQRGYRRPLYVGVPEENDPRAHRRFQGVHEAFQEFSGKEALKVEVSQPASFEGGVEGCEKALSADPLPDVLCFLNDHMAFGGLMHCEHVGLTVPGQIGIVGFNDLGLNNILPKRITTSTTPRAQMGARGAHMLIARSRNARTDTRVCMPTTIHPGATTRG